MGKEEEAGGRREGGREEALGVVQVPVPSTTLSPAQLELASVPGDSGSWGLRSPPNLETESGDL